MEVDHEIQPIHPFNEEFDQKNPDFELRGKTSLRMLYEAQVQVIRKQIGSLEDVRKNLGLSQRKMAQLLLVDPSAWTRWTRASHFDSAPPHIWRALQWYLALQEKIPGLTNQYFALDRSPVRAEATETQLRAHEKKLSNLEDHWSMKDQLTLDKVEDLKKDLLFIQKSLDFYRKWTLFLGGILVILALFLFKMFDRN